MVIQLRYVTREYPPAPLIATELLHRFFFVVFQRDMAFYVCYPGGVAIRTSPSSDAPCVGEVLQWKEVSLGGK